MTAVATADREHGFGVNNASEAELLDVLYEILAQGGDADGKLSADDVERFLHEHARAPKSLEQMRAFFAEHGLSADLRAYTADSELAEVASGLHRERGPSSVIMPLDAEAEPAIESMPRARVEAPIDELADETSGVITRASRIVQKRSVWPRVAVGAALVIVASGFIASHLRAERLEEKLSIARLQQQSTDAALSALEQRAVKLGSELSQSEAQRAAQSSKFEAFVAAQTEQRAAEQAALERMLGPRYRTLTEQARAQAASEAALPTP